MDLETILKNNRLLYYKLREMAIYYHNCSETELLAKRS